MDTKEKNLIKLNAQIESYQSEKFSLNSCLTRAASSLYCLTILVSNKVKEDNDRFACTFFFDCIKTIVYLDDHNTVFGGNRILNDTVKNSFAEGLGLIRKILGEYPVLNFKVIQTTTRMPEKFDFLISLGFTQLEQLNHYGNTKFQLFV